MLKSSSALRRLQAIMVINFFYFDLFVNVIVVTDMSISRCNSFELSFIDLGGLNQLIY